MSTEPWKILPHGTLTGLAADLFTVNGREYAPFGESTRRMSVVRNGSRELTLFGALRLRDDTIAQLQQLGRLHMLVVPGPDWVDDAILWAQRFPELTVVAAPALAERLSQYSYRTPQQVALGAHRISVVPGTGERELSLTLEGSTGTTLLVDDVLFNLPRARGMRGTMMRVLGAGPGPAVAPLVRLRKFTDSALVGREFVRWATLPRLERIVMSQGEPISSPRAVLLKLGDELQGHGRPAAARERHSLTPAHGH